MKLEVMTGIKMFKQEEDNINIIRITSINKSSSIITIDDGNEKKVVKEDFLKDYTPIEPDGYLTFNIVKMNNGSKDIVVTGSKYSDIKKKQMMPYCVCRQSITDIFYNLIRTSEVEFVGLSVSQDTCPSNFEFANMLVCSSIEYSENVNIYITDTIEDILDMVNTKKYNKVLNDLYTRHCKAAQRPKALFKDIDLGWCKNISALLKYNNFSYDLSVMLGVVELDFDLENCIIKSDLESDADQLTIDVVQWLSETYKININKTFVIEYDVDINLDEFKNSTYFIFKDVNNKVYLVVYTTDGEYLEKELEEQEENKTDFSTQYRLKFIAKYN